MSRYPTIDAPPTALDSNPLPYQRVDAPLAAFGGRDAAVIGQLGDLLQQGAARFGNRTQQDTQDYRLQMLKQRSLAPESAANDAMNQFRHASMRAYGDYSGTRMQDAVDGHADYHQAVQGARTAALDTVDGSSRTMLLPELDRAYHEAVQLGLQHRSEQDHAWSDQSSLGTLAANQQEAVLRRDDPDRVQALADHGIGEWIKIGERRGWSDQQIGQQVAQSKALLFGDTINAHLQDGNTTGAQTLFDMAQGQADPATLQQVLQNRQAPKAGPPPQQNSNPPQQPPDNPSEQPQIEPGELREQNAAPQEKENGTNPSQPTQPDGPGGQPEMPQSNAGWGQYSSVDPGLVQLAGWNSDQEQAQITDNHPVRQLSKGPTARDLTESYSQLPAKPNPVLESPTKEPKEEDEAEIDFPYETSREFRSPIAREESHFDYGSIGYKYYTEATKDHKKGDYILGSDGKKIPTAWGKYQFKKGGLQQVGILGKNGDEDWNTDFGKTYGISSMQDFLNNPKAQEVAFQIYMAENWRQLTVAKAMDRIGQTVQSKDGSFKITLSGLMAAAHREGPDAVRKYLAFLAGKNWQSPGKRTPTNKDGLPEVNSEIERRMRESADKPYFPNSHYGP